MPRRAPESPCTRNRVRGGARPRGAALAGNGGLLPPPPHSPNAHRIRDAYIFVAIFCGDRFVVVEGALIALSSSTAAGSGRAPPTGSQIHGSTRLEIIWTVVPV